ncbi:MAG: ATP-binding protein [Candidatus Omnitrophica bacterium]|nr:ATP-binding protein [Candidatus Omnitrophota bacterium]
MIRRILHQKCVEFSRQYPVVTITGPRQSGKTTLAKACFPQKPYVNLEEPDKRKLAIEDPRGFLENLPTGAVLDEIQRAPQLSSYIQSIVDSSSQKGMFIFTGSQQFEITQSISQSLAGRTALIKLLPFNLKELGSKKQYKSLDDLLIKGFYPRVYKENLKPHNFYMNYFEAYVQRDLRQLSQIENLHVFEKFVRILATRTGQLLNYNSLANDVGVSQPTIRKWISLLEASYIIFLLPPFFRNIGKRLIKTPKIYFYDVGLAAYLLEIENAKQLKSHPLRGNLFENLIITEFLKARFNQAKTSNLYFYRDRTGNEIDLVLQNPLSLTAVEIKSSATLNLDFCRTLNLFKKIFGQEVKKSFVVYCGKDTALHNRTTFLPWQELTDIKI